MSTAARSTRRSPDEIRRPGDLLVRVGGVLFAVGMVATMATVAPLLLDLTALPTAAYVVSTVAMALGFGLALTGMLRAAIGQRRRVAERERERGSV